MKIESCGIKERVLFIKKSLEITKITKEKGNRFYAKIQVHFRCQKFASNKTSDGSKKIHRFSPI